MAKDKVYTGTGRRKTSVARVTLTRGTGKITINGRDVNEYFPHQTMVMDLTQPLDITGTRDIFDVTANVSGEGCSGQAGAVRHGITKALLIYDAATPVESENSFRRILKKEGFITRDPRKKERKKPGLKKARRAPQFSKR